MKNLLLFILVLISTGTFSQPLKTVTIKEPAPLRTKEVYQVLKENPGMKQGAYRKYKFKKIIETGFFKNNKKDSAWQIYSLQKKLIASGNYKENLKTGVWNYYSKAGNLVQKYDHDHDTLLYFNVDEERKFGHAPWSYPDTTMEQLPIFIGGFSYMQVLIENSMIYPEKAFLLEKTGQVIISMVVDKKGNTTDVKIVKQAGYGFDEEAIRLVESLGKAWIPGKQMGKHVQTQFRMPIKFKLE